MCRLSRYELFKSDEMAIVHVMNRTVRRCFLMGQDSFTGKNYDYRKDWIEQRMEHLAKYFGIDVLGYSILSNHFHLVLRQPCKARDRAIAPAHLDELRDALQVMPSSTGYRCNDRGFLNMSQEDYIELLDWTARLVVPGKRGSTPVDAPPVFERLNLGLSVAAWTELVSNFRKLFSHVAGRPQVVEAHRSKSRHQRFRLSQQAVELLCV